eukprot:518495-Pelagomonas_calceolata.AAC.1
MPPHPPGPRPDCCQRRRWSGRRMSTRSTPAGTGGSALIGVESHLCKSKALLLPAPQLLSGIHPRYYDSIIGPVAACPWAQPAPSKAHALQSGRGESNLLEGCSCIARVATRLKGVQGKVVATLLEGEPLETKYDLQ